MRFSCSLRVYVRVHLHRTSLPPASPSQAKQIISLSMRDLTLHMPFTYWTNNTLPHIATAVYLCVYVVTCGDYFEYRYIEYSRDLFEYTYTDFTSAKSRSVSWFSGMQIVCDRPVKSSHVYGLFFDLPRYPYSVRITIRSMYRFIQWW